MIATQAEPGERWGIQTKDGRVAATTRAQSSADDGLCVRFDRVRMSGWRKFVWGCPASG
jgi:hypothetical protein